MVALYDQLLVVVLVAFVVIQAPFTAASNRPVNQFQYDTSATGANTDEQILTPANVNSKAFGKLGTWAVDGNTQAQPLYVPQVSIPGKGNVNVLIVCTHNNSVYGFNADDPGSTPLWKTSLGPWVSWKSNGCGDISPTVGVTSTPMIHPTTGKLMVVAKVKDSSASGFDAQTHLGGTDPYYTLNVLDVSTGAFVQAPAKIAPTVPGKGCYSGNGLKYFNANYQTQRSGLTLHPSGLLLVTFGSTCDTDAFSGWLAAINTDTLQIEAAWNSVPGGCEGGIWSAGAAPLIDLSGAIYFSVGNGDFGNTTIDGTNYFNYGSAIMKLSLTRVNDAWQFLVLDYFSPFNQVALSVADLDSASCGVSIQQSSGGTVIYGCGKAGVAYAMDPNNLGGFDTTPGITHDSRLLAEWCVPDATSSIEGCSPYIFNKGHGMWGKPGLWNNNLYFHPFRSADDTVFGRLQQYNLNPTTGLPLSYTPSAVSPVNQGSCFAFLHFSISADGSSNGIVWEVMRKVASDGSCVSALVAWDATDIKKVLFTSDANQAQDGITESIPKFGSPIVTNGRVYGMSSTTVYVWGLRSSPPPPDQSPPPPTQSPPPVQLPPPPVQSPQPPVQSSPPPAQLPQPPVQSTPPGQSATVLPVTNGLVACFYGENYNPTAKVWTDVSPSRLHLSAIATGGNSGNISGNIQTFIEPAGFTSIGGGISDIIKFRSNIITKPKKKGDALRPYTFFHVARYSDVPGAQYFNRIFDSAQPDNWFSGHHSNHAGVAYHGQFLTPKTDVHGHGWVLSTDSRNLYRSQGVQRSTTGDQKTSSFSQLTINAGVGVHYKQLSDWKVAAVLWYNRVLSLAEIKLVEKFLATKYGVSLQG